MEFRPDEITKIIRSQIKNYDSKIEQSQTGTVITLGDGIAKAAGLEKCMVNELIEFPNGSFGMAQNLEEHTVSIVILGSDEGIREGDTVKRTGRVVSVPVGEALIGRVVNALGEPIDGKGKIFTQEYRPIESPAPGIIERKSVSVPLQTGIKAIDAMIPIGRGQRELIIGDRHRHHHQPARQGRHLHLRGHRPEALHRGPDREHPHDQRRHGLHHRGLRHRVGACAHAVHRALFRLHHG